MALSIYIVNMCVNFVEIIFFFRPQILTFDEKRKRAKLVVISASKLNGQESQENQTEEDNDEASEDELVVGDTVHKDTNGRGKVLCTRL